MMQPSVWAMILAGGPIMLILIGLSVISLAVIVAKLIQLVPANAGAARREAAFDRWKGGDRAGAEAALAQGRSPADRLVLFAMQAIRQGLPAALMEAELTRRGNEEVARLSGQIRLLELIAMVSPLLGLLGTVLGMVQSFQDLASAEGAANASVLAGGIWLALLTTAGGLIVAIPAAVAASLLSGRVESVTLGMESAVGRLMVLTQAGAGVPSGAA